MRWILPFLCFVTLGAQDGQRKAQPGWPCVAGRAVDPSYLQLSESTGGQLFLFQKGEMEHAGIVWSASMTHPGTLFRAVGQLSGEKVFEFPVDSTVESLLLMASVQCRQAVSLYDPSGPEARPTKDVPLQAGRIVRIDQPSFGVWKLKLSGQGLFVFSVLVKSKVTISVAEDSEQFRVMTSGFASDPKVVQLAPNGDRVENAERYRIAVEGTDSLGYKVLRTHPVLIQENKKPRLQARAIVGY